MDTLDVRILRCLLDDCRLSDRQIGLRLGVSGSTAGARIKRMLRAGIIERFVLRIEPPVLGRGIFYAGVASRDAARVVEQVGRIGMPFVVVPCVGDTVVFGITVDGDVARGVGVARELMRDMRVLTIFEAESGQNRARLTRTDLAIMRALMDDPRAAIDALAAGTGFSTKTVTRSIEKLRADASVQFTAVFNPVRMRPYIPHAVMAWTSGDPSAVGRRLSALLSERFIQSPYLTERQAIIFLFTDSVYSLDDTTQRVREVEGVESADLFIPKRISFPQEWAAAAIADALKSPRLHIAPSQPQAR